MLIRLSILLFNVFSITSSMLEVHQEFSASKRVALKVERRTYKFPEPLPTILELHPHSPRTYMQMLDSFSPVFNFSFQLLDSENRTRLGDQIHRSVKTTQNQPWFNDTFIVSGISLSIFTRISCAKNYFGPQCEQFCDVKLAKSGRKRCDAMGRLRCDVGWMGPHCSQVIDPRKCECQNHGVCASSVIHNGTAESRESLICECVNGFTGDKCKEPAFGQFAYTAPNSDSCSNKDACLNGAQCFPNGPRVYCACPPGFLGEFCEVSLFSQTPAVEISANTSGSSYTVYISGGIFLFMILIAACFTYKYKPSRENALTRGQDPLPYAMPERKSMLIDPEAALAKKVFTIEDSVQTNNEEERYTAAPHKAVCAEYAVIQKANSPPPPPTVLPPPIPHYV